MIAAWVTAVAMAMAVGPAAAATGPDGALEVPNPHGLQALGPIEPGAPIYPRVDGRLMFGTTDNAVGPVRRTASEGEVAGIATALGASFVRLNLSWPAVESVRDQYDWRRYDAQYAALIAQGVRPLWIVQFSPRHTVHRLGVPCAGPDGAYCMGEPDDTEDALGQLQQFGAELARRYPLAAGFEYRNEPNLSPSGRCPPVLDPALPGTWAIPPKTYAAHLARFAAGVRSVRPDMRILGGALAGCATRYAPYAEAMLRAGAGNAMSALSWHPNAGGSPARRRDAFIVMSKHLQSAIEAGGVPDERIVAGEVSARTGSSPNLTERQVSEVLRTRFSMLSDPSSTVPLAHQTDAFVGFEDIDRSQEPGFGWLARRDMLGRFAARAVFCDWRAMLGVARPLPSYVSGCLL